MSGEPTLRILVVDDEPQIRKALGINLRARGYEVELAASGEEGLQLAAERHIDVALVDLGLPGIEGIDVVRGIRGWSECRDRAVGTGIGAGQGGGPRRRRRRLRDQAVRDGGVVGPDPGRHPPTSGRDEEQPVIVAGDWPSTSPPTRDRLGPAGVAHPDRVAAAGGPGPPSGQLVTQRQLLQQVWGPAYERESNYLRVHFGNSGASWSRPGPAPPRDHRTRHRLPLPALGRRARNRVGDGWGSRSGGRARAPRAGALFWLYP